MDRGKKGKRDANSIQESQLRFLAYPSYDLALLKVAKIDDGIQNLLRSIEDGNEIPAVDATTLHKKRKLIVPQTWKTYKLSKGPKFSLSKKKQATDLTHDMILKHNSQPLLQNNYII